MSRLLALDQSSHTTGYAIFIDGKFSSCGKFTISDNDLGVRLSKIRDKIKNLIVYNDIDEVIFEDIQLQEKSKNGTFDNSSGVNNIATFKLLAEVFGVVYELLTEMKIPNSAVLPIVWRATLGIPGYHRAEQKKNTQLWVEKVYGITPTEDECDAIGIGSHALIMKVNNKFKAKKIHQKREEEKGFDWS